MMTCNERCRRAILEPALETRKLQMKTIVEDMKGMEVCSIAFSWQNYVPYGFADAAFSLGCQFKFSNHVLMIYFNSPNHRTMFWFLLIPCNTCCFFLPSNLISYGSGLFILLSLLLHWILEPALQSRRGWIFFLWLQPRGGGLQVPGVMKYSQGFPSQVSIASDTIWKCNAGLATVSVTVVWI